MKRICLVLLLGDLVLAQDLSTAIDVKTLSELPMSKLLKVKNSFELDKGDFDKIAENESTTISIPGTLALRRSLKKPDKRGGWEEEHKGDSKKSVQSIFQLSVTTLAFLAFGGYLLCLIVQSLKDKGGKKVVMIVPMSSTMASVTMMTRRRRRRRRPLRIRRPIRPKREIIDNDYDEDIDEEEEVNGEEVDMWPHADPEKMFDALVNLSEAYTLYHTVDYRKFNQTIRRF